MDSIKINDGTKRIFIADENDGPQDPARVLVFNPSNTDWARKFAATRRGISIKINDMLASMKAIEKEFDAAEGEIEKETDVLVRCATLRDEVIPGVCNEIEALFGPGSVKIIFNGPVNESAIISFLEGIEPHIQMTRSEKMAQYAPPVVNKRNKHKKVMS